MKVDWGGVMATAGVAVAALVVLRTVEEVFPVTQKLTNFPALALRKLFG